MRKYDKASLYAELDSQLKQARLRSTNVQNEGFVHLQGGCTDSPDRISDEGSLRNKGGGA